MKVVLTESLTTPIRIKLNIGDIEFSEAKARELRDMLTTALDKMQKQKKEDHDA